MRSGIFLTRVCAAEVGVYRINQFQIVKSWEGSDWKWIDCGLRWGVCHHIFLRPDFALGRIVASAKTLKVPTWALDSVQVSKLVIKSI